MSRQLHSVAMRLPLRLATGQKSGALVGPSIFGKSLIPVDGSSKLMQNTSNTILYYGVVSLLIWTPLVFGATHPWTYGLAMLHIFALAAIWLGQRWWTPERLRPAIIYTPLTIPYLLFLFLLLLQLIPLPVEVLQILSPKKLEVLQSILPYQLSDRSHALFADFNPASWQSLSFFPFATRQALLKCLAYLTLFLVVVNTIRSRQQIKTVYFVIVGIATAMAIVGIAQRLIGTNAIYGLYEVSHTHFFGPYINRNHIASYFAAAMILALGLLLAHPAQPNRRVKSIWRRAVRWLNDQFLQHRVVLLYALAVLFGALCLSFSRGGMLSFAAGLICLSVWLANRRGWRWQMMLGMAVVAVVSASIAWLGVSPFVERFEALADGKKLFAWGVRLPIYLATWDLSQDFWRFGIGFDAFSAVFPLYQPEEAHSRYFHFMRAHNEFLQLLAETGVLGLALVAVGLWRLSWDIARSWRTRRDPFISVMVPAGCAAVCVVAVHSAVDFPLRIPANAILITVVLALTYSCVHLLRRGAAAVPGHDAPVTSHISWHPQLGTLRHAGVVVAVIILVGGSVEAVRITRSDLLYPQESVTQQKQWFHDLDVEVAYQRLQAALRWAPDNPHYWRALANLKYRQAQHHLEDGSNGFDASREAMSELRQTAHYCETALRHYPTEPHTQIAWLQVQQQLEALQAGASALPSSFEKRLRLYRQVALLAPVNPHIQYGIGRLVLADQVAQLRRSGAPLRTVRSYESAPFFRAALSFDPTYGERVLNACRQYRSAGAAQSCLTASIPNRADGHLIAAELLDEIAWAQARFHFLAAHALAPSDPQPAQLYAQALQRHGEWAEAAEMWENVRRLKPDDAIAYHGLIDVYRELGDDEAQLQIYQELTRRHPYHVGYRRQLGALYQQRGMLAEAEANWRQFTEMHPQDVAGYIELAKAYEARQAYDEALDMMLGVRDIAFDHADYQRTLARLYQQAGQGDNALQAWERLAALEPGNPTVLYQVAEHLRQGGKPLLALGYYRRASELKPNHAAFDRTLREVQQQLRLSSGQ